MTHPPTQNWHWIRTFTGFLPLIAVIFGIGSVSAQEDGVSAECRVAVDGAPTPIKDGISALEGQVQDFIEMSCGLGQSCVLQIGDDNDGGLPEACSAASGFSGSTYNVEILCSNFADLPMTYAVNIFDHPYCLSEVCRNSEINTLVFRDVDDLVMGIIEEFTEPFDCTVSTEIFDTLNETLAFISVGYSGDGTMGGIVSLTPQCAVGVNVLPPEVEAASIAVGDIQFNNSDCQTLDDVSQDCFLDYSGDPAVVQFVEACNNAGYNLVFLEVELQCNTPMTSIVVSGDPYCYSPLCTDDEYFRLLESGGDGSLVADLILDPGVTQSCGEPRERFFDVDGNLLYETGSNEGFFGELSKFISAECETSTLNIDDESIGTDGAVVSDLVAASFGDQCGEAPGDTTTTCIADFTNNNASISLLESCADLDHFPIQESLSVECLDTDTQPVNFELIGFPSCFHKVCNETNLVEGLTLSAFIEYSTFYINETYTNCTEISYDVKIGLSEPSAPMDAPVSPPTDGPSPGPAPSPTPAPPTSAAGSMGKLFSVLLTVVVLWV